MGNQSTKGFFISYTRADQSWAEWIAWQIEAAGYTSVIQAWDFRPGENFVLEMHDALATATRVVAVLSQSYVDAVYAMPEWAAAFARDPTGSKVKLVPVRVERCELTGLLEPIIYIDLIEKDEEDARQALLDGLAERGKPAKSPPFPGGKFESKPVFPGQAGARPAETSSRGSPSMQTSGPRKADPVRVSSRKDTLTLPEFRDRPTSSALLVWLVSLLIGAVGIAVAATWKVATWHVNGSTPVENGSDETGGEMTGSDPGETSIDPETFRQETSGFVRETLQHLRDASRRGDADAENLFAAQLESAVSLMMLQDGSQPRRTIPALLGEDVWVGTENGAYRYRDDRLTRFLTGVGITSIGRKGDLPVLKTDEGTRYLVNLDDSVAKLD